MSNKFFQPQVHPKYRPDIDGLRAIAVLTVVAFHAFPDWIFSGFIGVDIFFVISGFLITEIIYRNLVLSNFNLLTFILRRIRRLFPALVIVLFVTFTLAEITLSKLDQVEIGKQVFAGIFFMSNLYFRNLGDYFGPDSKDLALLNLWSLAVEEQFYLVWPPILMLIFSLKRKFLLPALICIGVYSFFVNIAGGSVSSTASFFGPISRFWELILGGLSFFLLDYLKRESIQSKWLSIVGIFLITTGYISIDSKNYSGWWALYPTAGTALIIISDRGSLLNKVLSCKPLVYIGLISYPIYLWHWPLLFFTRAYFVNPSTY
jgi:peptidoglycan/LPS O-acetylase OafA/YrhL